MPFLKYTKKNKKLTNLTMGNSDGDMPSLPQKNNLSPEKKEEKNMVEEPQKTTKKPAEEKSEANVVRQKKPFFTMGKILAIFGVLLIIGTVVGALIYSQSADRFEGDLLSRDSLRTNVDKLQPAAKQLDDSVKLSSTAELSEDTSKSAAEEQVTETDATTGTITNTSETTEAITMDMETKNDAIIAESGTVEIETNDSATSKSYKAADTTTDDDGPCDTANNWERTSDDVQICICEQGYVATDLDDPCVKIDYCTITEDELQAYLDSRWVSYQTKKDIRAEVGKDLSKYQEENCQSDLIVTQNMPETTFYLPESEALTCDELKEALGAAYFAQEWEEYTMALVSMQEQECIAQCEALFYKAVMELEQGQLDGAQSSIDRYLKNCTDDCTLTYDMMALYAEKLSEVDQAPGAPAASEEDLARLKEFVIKYIENCQCFEIDAFLTDPGFPEEDYFNRGTTNILNKAKKLSSTEMLSPDHTIRTAYAQSLSSSVQGVIEDAYNELCVPDKQDKPEVCTSLTIQEPSSTGSYQITEDLDPEEDFLEFKVDFDENIKYYEISSQTITFDGDSNNITTTNKKVTLEGGPEAGEEDVITITAFEGEQSDTFSKRVEPPTATCSAKITITRPEDPPKRDEPEVCTSLEISAPSSTGTYEIDEPLDPGNDSLEFKVDSDENIEHYQISSQTITFDENSKSITTANKEVSLEGGPEAGGEDIIKVVAVDPSGALIDACSAEIKITRPEDPPIIEEDPICRSLEIVSPGYAAEPGVPTIELSEGEYSNKVLEISVDEEAGSIEDYKYSSANGYITFNGQETLYTADKTVIMEGIVPEGATETISVWARKTETLEGIQACNDGYVVTVPEEEEPPPPEDPPPPVTVTEEEPPPPVQEIVVTEEPAPEPEPEPEPTPQPVHTAAPKVADTGPGILIYVFGAGIGGALLRKKRQK